MSELRKDPVVGRWVIIAADRAGRPNDFSERTLHHGGRCPFDDGQETLTPSETMAYAAPGRSPNARGWYLRVVPNRFPALTIEGALLREGVGIFDKMSGIGAHEVIIETPRHETSMGDLSRAEVESVLAAYRDRIRDLKRDERFRHILVFKNQGRAAGATLEHAHSQLIALPIVPRNVIEELRGAEAYFTHKERCPYCDIIAQERKDSVRLIFENEHAIALAPWAPKSPFETWVLPKTHAASYEEAPDALRSGVAEVMRVVLRKLDVALERPPLNYMLHTAPLRDKPSSYYHWHFEIVPRLTGVAGFEWGSGFFINPTSPEEAAAFLRKTEVG